MEAHGNGLSFSSPKAFWAGCLAMSTGVLAHAPMFIHSSLMGYQMVDMPIDNAMMVSMALIVIGFLLAAYGLLPRITGIRKEFRGLGSAFQIANSVPLNRQHALLVLVLTIALAIDVMKPATLGFVIPGLSREYGITPQVAAWLAFVALAGTTVGSLVWGSLADRRGRRAAILLSALMFMGTSICGAMPTFEWNLAMCFLMGASAGGLLPITFTLMAEVVPTRHRGWLLVAMGGIGTSVGYLLAAGAAAVIEPVFSWRVLWLLGLPTGAIIVLLDRFIPESPRFLVNAGQESAARLVLAKFTPGCKDEADTHFYDLKPVVEPHFPRLAALFTNDYAMLTLGLVVCGISWGLVNFGFLLWLPTTLRTMGMDARVANTLLASSAGISLLGIPVVTWLYQRWSSIKALVLLIGLTATALFFFVILGLMKIQSQEAVFVGTALLLVSASGVIAMLIPYAAEIYPIHCRATGTGLIAASSKLGGILGALAGVLGVFDSLQSAAAYIAAPLFIAAVLLLKSGIDTRGLDLEAIQHGIRDKQRVAH